MADNTPEKPKCNIGLVFPLLIDGPGGADIRARLMAIGKEASEAINIVWSEMRARDPASPGLARERQAANGGKLKIPKYDFKTMLPRGYESWYFLASGLCPHLNSNVSAAISNRVCGEYIKRRISLLTGQASLPRITKSLVIPFKGRAAKILRNPDNPNWFQVRLSIEAGKQADRPPMLIDFKSGGQKAETLDWLGRIADHGIKHSDVLLTLRKRGKRRRWVMNLARELMPGERDEPSRAPLAGRWLCLWPPVGKKDMFLQVKVLNPDGKAWPRDPVEAHTILHSLIIYKKRLRIVGANYRQSPTSGAHGHGRRRATVSLDELRQRYRRRIGSWIEQRTTFLVEQAIAERCEGICIVDLTCVNPKTLLLGKEMDYAAFLRRLDNKCTDRIKLRVFDPPADRLGKRSVGQLRKRKKLARQGRSYEDAERFPIGDWGQKP